MLSGPATSFVVQCKMKTQAPLLKNREELSDSHSTALKQAQVSSHKHRVPAQATQSPPDAQHRILERIGTSFRATGLSSPVPVQAFDTSLTCDSERVIQTGTAQGLGLSRFWKLVRPCRMCLVSASSCLVGQSVRFLWHLQNGKQSRLNEGC